jgi:hypothetical protein
MLTLRERQVHMTQLIKRLDRMVVEKHNKFNAPFYHYQKPLAAPGERDSVCVYIDAVKREYLPYGIELEKMVEEARLWVKTGEGPRPEVMIAPNQDIALARETPSAPATGVSDENDAAGGETLDERRTRRVGSRRKIFSASAELPPKNRTRPPTLNLP